MIYFSYLLIHGFIVDCRNQFAVQFGHNAEGATPYDTITNRKECMQLCTSMSDCTAIDYDYNDPPYKNANCWIHTDDNIIVKTQHQVDHYTRDMCEAETRKWNSRGGTMQYNLF